MAEVNQKLPGPQKSGGICTISPFEGRISLELEPATLCACRLKDVILR